MRNRVRAALGGIAFVSVMGMTAGCATSVEDIPLPGGADVGSNPMHLSVEFDDVLDLVRQGSVKVNGLPAGRVENIGLTDDGWHAKVDITVRSDVDLPSNAVASIQQTNILGEKFIELSSPDGAAPQGKLADGDDIPLDRTRTATNIEQVLGALSLLLNGGGLSQLQSIVAELNQMTNGREDQLKTTLNTTADLIASLNRQRDSIVKAIDGVNELSKRANEQTPQIEAALDELPAGVQVLDEQRPQLVDMLNKLNSLGEVGSDVLLRSRDDLIADLRALRPVLQELANFTPGLIEVTKIVPTFPFPDSSNDATVGSSTNVFLTVDGDIANTLSNLGVGKGDPIEANPQYTSGPYSNDPNNPWTNGNGPDKRTSILLPLLPEPAVMQRATTPAETPGLSPFSPTMGGLLADAEGH
ncbi:MCE family protein [Dietzia sp.]|uniref:MCE family protein n=1 Tax=Dietzia sp. TaxID=1871616 RepID=UPI002FDB043D